MNDIKISLDFKEVTGLFTVEYLGTHGFNHRILLKDEEGAEITALVDIADLENELDYQEKDGFIYDSVDDFIYALSYEIIHTLAWIFYLNGVETPLSVDW